MACLTKVMLRKGFTAIESEWWHFNDAVVAEYDLIDPGLEVFTEKYFSRQT